MEPVRFSPGSKENNKENKYKMNGKRRKKKLKLWAVAVPLVLLVAYFAVNPDRWYMLTAGSGRQEVSVKKNKGTMETYSLESMQENEHFQFNQSLMLINTEYMLSEDFMAETAEYKDSGVDMNACMTGAYGALADAVKASTGDKLYVSSSIRDKKHQQELYEEDPETATVPGASEHETGLCLDVYVAYYAGDGFLKSEAGQFVNSYCDEYGFIIRYPSYGEKETGIRFEPWHIRYVGFPHSEIIYNNRLTLEEYIFSLEEGVCYEANGYYITRQRPVDGKVNVPTGCDSYIVSPDNTGCYVITGKKTVGKIKYLETI